MLSTGKGAGNMKNKKRTRRESLAQTASKPQTFFTFP